MDEKKTKKKIKRNIPVFFIITSIWTGIMIYFFYIDPDIITGLATAVMIYSIFSQIRRMRKEKDDKELPRDRYCVQIYGDRRKTKIYTQQFVRSVDEGISWMKKQKITNKNWDIFDTYTGKIVRETKK